MKLNSSFRSSRFDTWSKSQDKNLNILRTKRAFLIEKLKSFFIIFKGLSVSKNCLRPKSTPLISKYFECFHLIIIIITRRKKSPYSKLFWSVFSRTFPHSDWMRRKSGKNADQNNSEYSLFLRSVSDAENITNFLKSQ